VEEQVHGRDILTDTMKVVVLDGVQVVELDVGKVGCSLDIAVRNLMREMAMCCTDACGLLAMTCTVARVHDVEVLHSYHHTSRS